MLSEDKRRRIAREFLEKKFGKRGNHIVTVDGKTYVIPKTHTFELWKCYEAVGQAFYVLFEPYVTSSDNPVIAVSDSKKELMEITKRIVSENRVKDGSPKFEKFGKFYIMYD